MRRPDFDAAVEAFLRGCPPRGGEQGDACVSAACEPVVAAVPLWLRRKRLVDVDRPSSGGDRHDVVLLGGCPGG